MKKISKGIFMFVFVFMLVSCSQSKNKPVYTVTFDYPSISAITATANTQIDLPFVESESGFLLGWEDEAGTHYEGTYIGDEDMTLTPVFEAFEDVLELTYDDIENTVEINSYSGDAPYVKIPYMIDGYYVNAIDSGAFFETTVERVDLPMSVVKIGMTSFQGMPNLEEFHFYGDDLGTVYKEMRNTTVDEIIETHDTCTLENKESEPTIENPWVFDEGCPIAEIIGSTEADALPGPNGELNFRYFLRLDIVHAGEYINYSTSPSISQYAFINSTNLKTMTLHNLYHTVLPGQALFQGLENLEAVYIENNDYIYSEDGILYYDDANADTHVLWYYPSGLLEADLSIPEDITHVADGAFRSNKVHTLSLHENLTITAGALSFLTALETISVDPNHPTLMEVDGVLFNKSGTELLVYPAGKENTTYTTPDHTVFIKDRAFQNQRYLEHLIIYEGTTDIGNWVIYDTDALHTVDIASTVVNIGDVALSDSENIETVILRNPDTMYDFFSIKILSENHEGPFTIYVADHLLNDYLNAYSWQYYTEYFVPLSELNQ